MALSTKPLIIFCVLSALCFAETTSKPQPHGEDGLDMSLGSILSQLKSEIALLESRIDERTRELRSKDEKIRLMEKIIKEKSEVILLLHSELESFQLEGPNDAKEQTLWSYVRVAELEEQVDKLRKEVEFQNEKKNALEARAHIAERKIQELNFRVEDLQEINKEQKARIDETEHALQVAQEELMKANLQLHTMTRKSNKVQGEWLPSWLAVHFEYLKHHLLTLWDECLRPALDMTLRQKWIAKLKDQLVGCKNDPEVCFQTLFTCEFYHRLMSFTRQVIDLKETAVLYITEIKKFGDPYNNQVLNTIKSHSDKVSAVLKPYVKIIVRTCRDFITAASALQHKVQLMLKRNELTRPLANVELAWSAASAILALSVIFLFTLYYCVSSKRTTSRSHKSHGNHLHRRKRSYPASRY
ncbi:hypothetical protein K2173_015957 [Erythroxylum novogranatense]|uniref:Uncharacterized protein n=1 Tax=Erythroxylum novogranatense TaxID=1862640 RepID=A0AAV8SEV4_9ROSI|nr:hypothetical protein K2173_015957 [Erythroxylum novogranatense]